MRAIPIAYSVERIVIHGHLMGHRWQCFECESGNGSAPVFTAALQAAQTHFRSAHTSQETTVDPTPRRRRPDWWHAIARLITIPNAPRRAER